MLVSGRVHLGRLTWNLQITYLERKMIVQTSMIMFHVNLQGAYLSFQTQWFFNSDIPKFSVVINVAVSNARTSVSQETPCSRKDVTSSKSNILSRWFNQQVIHHEGRKWTAGYPWNIYMWYVYHMCIYIYIWICISLKAPPCSRERAFFSSNIVLKFAV